MPYKSSINTGLPNIPDPPLPEMLSELIRIYNAIRNVTVAIDAYTGGLAADESTYSQTPPTTTLLLQNMTRLYLKFDFTAAYGQTVYFYSNAGVLTAGIANATIVGRQMRGWCSTAAGVTSGNYGEVMLQGLCTAIGGLTIGTTYYNGNTPGTVANSPGTISQKVGFAIGTNQIFMRPEL